MFTTCRRSARSLSQTTNHRSNYCTINLGRADVRNRQTVPDGTSSQHHRLLNFRRRHAAHSNFVKSDQLKTIRHEDDVQSPSQVYTPPTKGILSFLPETWVPYAELVRLDKPAGTTYLFFPCLFSTLLAAIHTPSIGLSTITGTSALFVIGAFIMRGAGCTINDLWDRNLDPLVARTALRPLARRAISPRAAIVFTGAQLLGGLALLLQLPPICLYYGTPSLVLVASYPLAKRVTHYPQLILGLTFSWGAFMGFPALGIDLLSDAVAAGAALSLYAGCVAWTIVYDMVYAHMDIRDDKQAGIKSIALRHETDTKKVLTFAAGVQALSLVGAGALLSAGPVYYTLTCGSAVASLGALIWRVNLKSVSDCWWWFRKGVWLTGGGISLGMLVEYLDRRKKSQQTQEQE